MFQISTNQTRKRERNDGYFILLVVRKGKLYHDYHLKICKDKTDKNFKYLNATQLFYRVDLDKEISHVKLVILYQTEEV